MLIVAIAAWAGFSPRCASGLYRDHLFRPQWGNGSQTELRSFNDVPNQEVFFPTADGGTLHGWYYANPDATKVVLVHPGNAGDMAGRLYLTKLLLRSGASVFQYEPRGFGMSAGTPSPQTICEDGLAAYDYLTGALGADPNAIVLYGLSLGASVATHVSTKRTTQAVIIHAGFSSLAEIAREKLPVMRIYPEFMFPSPHLNNVAILSRPHPPLLILHGEKDTLIPIVHAERIYRSAPEPRQFVRFPNSGHGDFDPDDIKLFVLTVSDFLARLP